MKTLKQLFSYFKPYLGIILLYLFIGMLIVSLAMILPQITKSIIASVIGDTPFSLFGTTYSTDKETLFIYLACAWLSIVILRQALSFLRGFLLTNASIKAVCKMREDVFEKMLWQSQTFLREENTGNVLTVINGDVEAIKQFFTGTVPAIIESLFGFIFASIMIGNMSPVMVITAYCFTIPLFIISKKFSKVFFKWYHFVRESSADLSMVTQENINGIRIVKAYAQEEQEKTKFEEKNEAFRYHAINYMVVWGKNYVSFGIISHIPNIVLTIMAALLVINGHTGFMGTDSSMELAEFIAIGGYVGYILVPFQNANNWINQAQQAATCAEKVFRFLNVGSIISSKPDAKKPDTSDVHIKFENAGFTANRKAVVEDITIDLPQGKTLGIMGTTGCGKTMVTSLMMRFFDTTSGRITINDIDIRDIDLTTLRSCFAPVLQDVFLFSDTIAKNIAYGIPDATFEDVRRCAKIAQADDFIMETPDEYNTVVGERGMGLSGGQKQRLSIARALLFNSPVLVFDDATSALDMETEQRLYAALKESGSNRTHVIIAHRISSVKDCDEIIILDKGKIIERGTHDELVALKGHYYEIYKEQYSTVLESM